MKDLANYKGKSMIRFQAILLLVFITSILVFSQTTTAQDEVRVFITGPNSIPTNVTVEYTIEIVGGPAEDEHLGVNETPLWRFEAELTSKIPAVNTVEPQGGNSTENIFKINVTAPNDKNTLSLEVNGTSSNRTEMKWSGAVVKEIEVFRPIPVNLSATIHNPSDLDIKDALISFYVDGIEVGNKTEDFSANSTKEVYYEWVASKDDRGEHLVEVRINEDGNLLEFNKGNNVISETIYIGDRPERPDSPIMIFNNDALLFFIGLMAFLFALSGFLMWNNSRRGRGYYSSGSTYSMYFVGLISIVLSIPVFSVSQILTENPEVDGDPTVKVIQAITIFILGFLVIFFTWDRTRKKR
jgi:hypothetical protein